MYKHIYVYNQHILITQKKRVFHFISSSFTVFCFISFLQPYVEEEKQITIMESIKTTLNFLECLTRTYTTHRFSLYFSIRIARYFHNIDHHKYLLSFFGWKKKCILFVFNKSIRRNWALHMDNQFCLCFHFMMLLMYFQ